ncbi:MAG TPA: hypothetical protein VKR60_04610 [Candidatus Sulfotelmatobacter sp.]|nr:hypothetical protein [Candidatus Sulfotelmatobacter sp.]
MLITSAVSGAQTSTPICHPALCADHFRRYGLAYAESAGGLNWTLPVSLGTFGPIAAYPTAVGLGDDPHVLGKSFYVYFTYLPTDGSGWTNGALRQVTVSCQ